jgi:hypothetical protein
MSLIQVLCSLILSNFWYCDQASFILCRRIGNSMKHGHNTKIGGAFILCLHKRCVQ